MTEPLPAATAAPHRVSPPASPADRGCWLPPLPEPIPTAPRQAGGGLTPGCYRLRYTPAGTPIGLVGPHLAGTLRVEWCPEGSVASGDLYACPVPTLSAPMAGTVSPDAAVTPAGASADRPVFDPAAQRCYLRLTELVPARTSPGGWWLGFELFRTPGTGTTAWLAAGSLAAVIAPVGAGGFAGELRHPGRASIGTIELTPVASALRRADLEVATVTGAARLEPPIAAAWQRAMAEAGWAVTLTVAPDPALPPAGSCSDAEVHAALLARRAAALPSAAWCYHLLAAPALDSNPRGIWFDPAASDSTNLPAAGALAVPAEGVAAEAVAAAGLALLARATGVLAGRSDGADGVSAGGFEPVVRRRLRHLPDRWVRPGADRVAPLPASLPQPGSRGVPGLELRLAPVRAAVPLGAPVRVNFGIANVAGVPLVAPASLSLRTGSVRGYVVDPAGTVRAFLPLLLGLDERLVAPLEPGRGVEHSLTLWRGPQGALFPQAGTHRVIVNVDWSVGGCHHGLTAETHVVVTAPRTEAHAAAAQCLLTIPDVLLTLALGGDHLPEGIAAVRAGLAEPALRPHLAWIEAKRLGARFGDRPADLAAAADLLEGDVVLSQAELRRVAELLRPTARAGLAGRSLPGGRPRWGGSRLKAGPG